MLSVNNDISYVMFCFCLVRELCLSCLESHYYCTYPLQKFLVKTKEFANIKLKQKKVIYEYMRLNTMKPTDAAPCVNSKQHLIMKRLWLSQHSSRVLVHKTNTKTKAVPQRSS